MTRNDLILIFVLIIFSLIPLTMNSDSAKKIAVIKIDSVIIRELDLTAEEIFTVNANGGKNVISVRNGAVSVIEGDCTDKICVQRGAIKNVSETIACVPHKLLIMIESD